MLESYAWPGNVRQLENSLQRLVLLAGQGSISMKVLESDQSFQVLLDREETPRPTFSFRHAALEELRGALQAAEGNRTRAAKLLGISRATIYRKIKELGLEESR